MMFAGRGCAIVLRMIWVMLVVIMSVFIVRKMRMMGMMNRCESCGEVKYLCDDDLIGKMLCLVCRDKAMIIIERLIV